MDQSLLLLRIIIMMIIIIITRIIMIRIRMLLITLEGRAGGPGGSGQQRDHLPLCL
jgi:hypothetical protein